MKTRLKQSLLVLAMIAGAAATRASAQEKRPEKLTCGIYKVETSPTLDKRCQNDGVKGELDLLTEAMRQHLMVSIDKTRKFDVIAGDDLVKLLEKQQVPINIIRDNDGRAMPGKIKGLDRLLTVTVTDFAFGREQRNVGGGGFIVEVQGMQATAVVKIYDTTTGVLSFSTTVQDAIDLRGVGLQGPGRINAAGGGAPPIIGQCAMKLAARCAQQLLDYDYPCRVLNVFNEQVTLSRGVDTEIAVGQVWAVYALGDALKDEDGNVLGRNELKVAEVTVTEVLPKFSKSIIRGSNLGVPKEAKDTVARLMVQGAGPRMNAVPPLPQGN